MSVLSKLTINDHEVSFDSGKSTGEKSPENPDTINNNAPKVT